MIPTILDIYNHCLHSSTGLTPYGAFTGRPTRHPQLMPDSYEILVSSTL
jgi:hypothetical protein